MKSKLVILNSDDYSLFVDSKDEDIIYAALKMDLEKALIERSRYQNKDEIPDDKKIKTFRLSIIEQNQTEDTYKLVDRQSYNIPISRIELKAFKIEYNKQI